MYQTTTWIVPEHHSNGELAHGPIELAVVFDWNGNNDGIPTLEVELRQRYASYNHFNVHVGNLTIAETDGLADSIELALDKLRGWNAGRKERDNEDIES